MQIVWGDSSMRVLLVLPAKQSRLNQNLLFCCASTLYFTPLLLFLNKTLPKKNLPNQINSHKANQTGQNQTKLDMARLLFKKKGNLKSCATPVRTRTYLDSVAY